MLNRVVFISLLLHSVAASCFASDFIVGLPREAYEQEVKYLVESDTVYFNGQFDPCVDLYRSTCSASFQGADGFVWPLLDKWKREKLVLEQEVRVNAIIKESLVPIRQLEIYHERYLSKRIDLVSGVLDLVKLYTESYLGKVAPELLGDYKSKIKAISIDSTYYPEFPKTYSDLFSLRFSVDGGRSIRIGGTFLELVESPSAYFFILAHEMGHVVNLKDGAFKNVRNCISQLFGAGTVLGHPIDQEEVWADWFAHQLFELYLLEQSVSVPTKTELVRTSLRAFCGSAGSPNGHPSGQTRVDFFLRNPSTLTLLCGKQTAKSNYCTLKP